MTQNSENIVVAGEGAIFAAVAGQVEPAFADDPLIAAWEDVGLITEAGTQLNYSRESTDIGAWGLKNPALTLVTGTIFEAVFAGLEWNIVSLPLFFGGGEFSEDGGEFIFEEPDSGEATSLALLIRWTANGESWQAWHPRGKIVGNSTVTLADNASADLPVTWRANPASGLEKFRIRTTSDQLDAGS